MDDAGLLGSVVGNGDFVGMTYALKEIGAFAKQGWTNVLPELQMLINGVVRLSLMMTMMVWLFKPSPDVISEFFWVVIKLNFVLWIMNNFWDIVQKIFDGMVGMGLAAAPDVVKGLTNTDALQDPGRIAKLGTVAVTPLIEHIDSMLGPVDFFLYITELLFAYGALVATVAMFLICGLLIFLATAEFYIVAIPAGCMAPFIAWNKSAFIATPAIAYVINTGIRLFGTTIVIVMGLSIMLAYKWPDEPTIQDSQNLLILTVSILAAALSVFKKMSGLINGGPVSDVGGALSAMWYAARLGGAAGKEISEVGGGLASGNGPLPRAASGFINGVRGGGVPGSPGGAGGAANTNSPGGLRGAFQRGVAGARANVAAGAATGGGSNSSWYQQPTAAQMGLARSAGVPLSGMNRAQATVALANAGFGGPLNTGSAAGIAAAAGGSGGQGGGAASSAGTGSSGSMKEKLSEAAKEISGGFREGVASGYGGNSGTAGIVGSFKQGFTNGYKKEKEAGIVGAFKEGVASGYGTKASATGASEKAGEGLLTSAGAVAAKEAGSASGTPLGASAGTPRRALEAADGAASGSTTAPEGLQRTALDASEGLPTAGESGPADTASGSPGDGGRGTGTSPTAGAVTTADLGTVASQTDAVSEGRASVPAAATDSNISPLGDDINGMSRTEVGAAIRERALALPKGTGLAAESVGFGQRKEAKVLGTDVSGMTRGQAAAAIAAHKDWWGKGVARAQWQPQGTAHPYASDSRPTPAHMLPKSSAGTASPHVASQSLVREGLRSTPTAPNSGDRPVMRSAAGAHVHRTFSPKSGGTGHQVAFNDHRNDGRFQIPGERLSGVGQGGGEFGTGHRPAGWQSPSVKSAGLSALSGENYWHRRSTAELKERHFGIRDRAPRAPKSVL